MCAQSCDNTNISKEKLCAEKTLGYILNKLRNHDQIIKNLHEIKGDGWRKMKYARGLFDRSVGFISLNDENRELISLMGPFHCKLKTSSEALYKACPPEAQLELIPIEKLFSECNIVVVQGNKNDFEGSLSDELLSLMKERSILILAPNDIKLNEESLVKFLENRSVEAVVTVEYGFSNKIKALPNVMLMK